MQKPQKMNMYVIFIDDELYESADNYEEAKHLYSTIDATCLAQYNGHRKSLMARIDGTDYRIKSGIISKSAKDVVRNASQAMMLRADGRVNDLPEDLAERILKEWHLQPVRLDENTVMYVSPNPGTRAYNPLATGICRRFANLADIVVGDVVLCSRDM